MSHSEDSEIAKGNRHIQGVEFDDGSDDLLLNFDESNLDRDQIGQKVKVKVLQLLGLDLDLGLSRVGSVEGAVAQQLIVILTP
ncbi:hypothetical protein PoB_003875300 [Plakobranchus ocellatus]|uniref:Uncharacterized protein n=1 Tax=Plakobranchus ocellatus TaxID=259542 RepID=A0AAV4AY45_9GAST|nr:hypothetical protein PoB_003875300 [Plakobranchus ocellatus]